MRIMFVTRLRVASFVVCFFLISCASDIHRINTEFKSATGESGRIIILSDNTEVSPNNGYPRILKANSKWKFVGQIPQGFVLAIQDDVFMLEAKHMHQAHLVLAPGNRLVGFFLPVEQAFVPISPSIPLSVKIQ
mgnify:CR=1 FL=1